jgi:hypothetical protein
MAMAMRGIEMAVAVAAPSTVQIGETLIGVRLVLMLAPRPLAVAGVQPLTNQQKEQTSLLCLGLGLDLHS